MRRAALLAVFLLCMPVMTIDANSDVERCKESFKAGDYATAFNECMGPAEQGDAKAELRLGYMYYSGKGVPKDQNEAIKWYLRAAEYGNAEAQFWLGNIYLFGQGVAKDYVTSYKWFSIAASGGNETAEQYLKNLEGRMTLGQISDAQRLSREFRSNRP